jgi:hypothetical protein
MLTIDPRLGARKGSRQSKATNTITANQANGGPGGDGGPGGAASAGLGGNPNGPLGRSTQGVSRTSASAGAGLGGGLAFIPSQSIKINNTNIAGNTASTAANDVLDSSE